VTEIAIACKKRRAEPMGPPE